MLRKILLIGVLFGLSRTLLATPPATLNYQGRIKLNSSNQPIPDSTGNTVTFNIYNVQSGGTALWSETWNGSTSYISSSSGLFSAILGSYQSLTGLAFDVPYYLEIVWTNTSGTAETLSPRQPLTSSPYAFMATKVTGPLDITSSTQSSALYGYNSASGAGVYGDGPTGTAGVAGGIGATGLWASDGGYPNALALKVNGGALFGAPGFVSFTGYADFSGATVTGISGGSNPPLTLNYASPANAWVLSASNTGSGYGIVAYNSQPGGFQGGSGGVPDLNSSLNAAIKGYSSVTSSAGVAGYSNLTVNGGVGVLGIGYAGVGGFGRVDVPGSSGGAFQSNAQNGQGLHGEADGLNGTGMSGSSVSGTGGSFNGLTGLAVSGNALALEVNGNANFNGGGSVGFQENVSFMAGTTVNFSGANVVGLSGIGAPLNWNYNFSVPLMDLANQGSGDAIDASSGGGFGVNASSSGSVAVNAIGQSYYNPALYTENNGGGDALQAYVGTGNLSYAIYGDDGTGNPSSIGVYGTSANGWGVYGEGTSGGAVGMEAINIYGGDALDVDGPANFGGDFVDFTNANVNFSGATVLGLSTSGPTSVTSTGANVSAIFGENTSNGPAIIGQSDGSGVGVYGSSQGNAGVEGVGISAPAVFGDNQGNSNGVYGSAQNGIGVYGTSVSNSAVSGNSSNSSATILANNGGSGPAMEALGTGGYGIEASSSGSVAIYVNETSNTYAIQGSNQGTGPGVYGFSAGNYGVYASSSSGSALYAANNGTVPAAVLMNSNGSGNALSASAQNGIAIYAQNTSPAPSLPALEGNNTSPQGYGILAQNTNATTNGAALYLIGPEATSFGSLTLTTGGTNSGTCNGAAGRVYITYAGTGPATLTITDGDVTANSIINLTMIGYPSGDIAPTVSIPNTGGSFTLSFQSVPSWSSPDVLNGFAFQVVHLQ